MTIHLTTFASPEMSRSAQLCIESGLKHGVNRAWRYDEPMLQSVGKRWHIDFNPAERGYSFWKWKPLIILEAIEPAYLLCQPAKDGDVIIYADAGIEFINSVNYIIDRMDQDIFLFGNQYEHAHWCKRDVGEAIWPCNKRSRCPSPHYEFWDKFGKQVQASVIFFRVNDKTRAFVTEWLDWCLFEGGRLVDDSPSRTPNHPEFQENRHDQAILTTMAYRDGIKLHWWPAQYNDGAFEYPRGDYPDEGYPILFHHHRGVKTGERAA